MSTEKSNTDPGAASPAPTTSAATGSAEAQVPNAVDRAGDTTPTKPGAEAALASSGIQEHSKHPPGEREAGAAVAVTGDQSDK
jgi:hypothetical protein